MNNDNCENNVNMWLEKMETMKVLPFYKSKRLNKNIKI